MEAGSKVEFAVKSFRRFDCLLRLVRSIRKHYPDALITIVDDSFEEPNPVYPVEVEIIRAMEKVRWFQKRFNIGLGAGRNWMARHAERPYVVQCDDDWVVTDETRIERMIAVLESPQKPDIVCGLIRDGGKPLNWGGRFEFESTPKGRRLHIKPLDSPWHRVFVGSDEVRFRQSDLGFNFYMARRSLLQGKSWDERLKVAYEHIDQFLDMHSRGWKIVYTPDVLIDHRQKTSAGYRQYRAKFEDGERILLAKWNLVGPPNHRITVEPGVPVTQPESAQPNILVLAVGHSGTTILCRMMAAMGWQLPDPEDPWAEPPGMRQVNQHFFNTGRFDHSRARSLLKKWPQPWILKDPRLVHTMQEWLPALAETGLPLMIHLRRDEDAIKASWNARNAKHMNGATVAQMVRKAQNHYEQYPGPKVSLRVEDIAEAVLMFDPARVLSAESNGEEPAGQAG